MDLIFSITLNNLGNGGAKDLSFLCSLSNVTYLNFAINDNNFGGELPKCIGNLSITEFRNGNGLDLGWVFSYLDLPCGPGPVAQTQSV